MPRPVVRVLTGKRAECMENRGVGVGSGQNDAGLDIHTAGTTKGRKREKERTPKCREG